MKHSVYRIPTTQGSVGNMFLVCDHDRFHGICDWSLGTHVGCRQRNEHSNKQLQFQTPTHLNSSVPKANQAAVGSAELHSQVAEGPPRPCQEQRSCLLYGNNPEISKHLWPLMSSCSRKPAGQSEKLIFNRFLG